MKRVYIETTIPSYLAALPSANLVASAHQHITHEWWSTMRHEYVLCTSDLVLEEAMQGNPDAAQRRLLYIRELEILRTTQEADSLTEALLISGKLPQKAAVDAYHIAIAAVHEVEILLTWNCRHIANPVIIASLLKIVAEYGYNLPVLCTPEVLLGERMP
jgi:hypothetical protein